MTSLAPTLQAFFTTRLTSQYGASPHTVAAYPTRGGCCSATPHNDRTAPTSWTFPARRGPDQRIPHQPANPAPQQHRHPQRPTGRGALVPRLRIPLPPAHLATIGRVLAIPPKRRPRNEICYLTDAEVTALLTAPDQDDQGRTA